MQLCGSLNILWHCLSLELELYIYIYTIGIVYIYTQYVYIYMYLRFISLIGYNKILSRVPCAVQSVLVGYLPY